jgi:hypothetical protein
MFSYYGSKSKLVKKYPIPIHNTIIEPFAGSARYSLLHHEGKTIFLFDTNPYVIKAWKWLQHATKNEVRNLPIVEAGESIPKLKSEGASYLIAFCFNQGTDVPRNFAGRMNFCKLPGGNWELVVKQLNWIRHWKIEQASYTSAPNIKATWFIDHPYIASLTRTPYFRGKDLNYKQLANWVKQRKGQIIVCENDSAAWLPFSPLAFSNGQRANSKLRNDGIWYREA